MSLRSRLLLAVGFIALLALIVADITVFTSLRSFLYNQAQSRLELSHHSVEEAANNKSILEQSESPPGSSGQPPGSSAFCAIGRESAPGMFIEVRSKSNKVVAGAECPAFAPGSQQFSPLLPSVISGYTTGAPDPSEPTAYFTVPSTVVGGGSFLVRASKLANGGVLVIADPINNISSTLGQLLLLEFLVTGGALIGSILLGLWLVRVGLRPLRDVVRTAELISGGDLEHRVPSVNPKTEVGHVATAFNFMLGRIQADFEDLQESENRLRRFVSDASHELRTPIAAISAYAQLFKRGASHREQDLPRVMNGIERESLRMAKFVDDLLLLARLDEQRPLELEPVELVGLAAEAVETARTVGPGWPISFAATVPIEVMGDRSALRQVIDNLLANVRAHTPQGTSTTVRVAREGQEAAIEVADEGPGITEEQARLVFERFFRADPSRTRATGGTGLGLAIVATIVEAHGGRATAAPRAGGGASFTVYLPALDAETEE